MDSRRRLARGSIAAALSTWVALAFHLIGGGEMPAVVGVVIPFVLSWCACVRLAGWRTDALRLTGSVVLSQALFHLLFVLGAPAQAVGGHHGSAVHLGGVDVAGAAPWMQMWPAHLVAAAITIIALRSGEQALRRLAQAALELAGRLCAAPALEPVVVPAGRPLAGRQGVRVQHDLGRFHRDITRRGPPVSVLSR